MSRLDQLTRNAASWLADRFDAQMADLCHVIAGRLRGWAGR